MVPYGICEAQFTHRSGKTSRNRVKSTSRINPAASVADEPVRRSFLASIPPGNTMANAAFIHRVNHEEESQARSHQYEREDLKLAGLDLNSHFVKLHLPRQIGLEPVTG